MESLEKSRDSPDAAPNALCASGEWYSLGCTHQPAHINMSESGDERLVVCRSRAHDIGHRRASNGLRPVTLCEKHPLCVWVRCALDVSGVDQQSV